MLVVMVALLSVLRRTVSTARSKNNLLLLRRGLDPHAQLCPAQWHSGNMGTSLSPHWTFHALLCRFRLLCTEAREGAVMGPSFLPRLRGGSKPSHADDSIRPLQALHFEVLEHPLKASMVSSGGSMTRSSCFAPFPHQVLLHQIFLHRTLRPRPPPYRTSQDHPPTRKHTQSVELYAQNGKVFAPFWVPPNSTHAVRHELRPAPRLPQSKVWPFAPVLESRSYTTSICLSSVRRFRN